MTAEELVRKCAGELKDTPFTLGELTELAEREGVPFSLAVVAEAMAKEGKTREQVLADCLGQFTHNLRALQLGITSGRSFLLGRVGSDLQAKGENVILQDRFLDRAVRYTLGTEVGNHEIGLRPCAGTGDSCPSTGLLRALAEEELPGDTIAALAAVMLKVGSYFRAGKQTTGCNMEGYGAGAAVTAAVLTDLAGGTGLQVARSIVLALSPTIAVPRTPRVMVSGLCAAHIGAAILVGNLASKLVMKSDMPVEVDVDVMLAMAARVHVEAAPVVTGINLPYLRPYFKKNAAVENFVGEEVKKREREAVMKVRDRAREEVGKLALAGRPLSRCLGEVVVGGSSLAVGSPANMSRICHALARGRIGAIDIELTTDLFVRRAINVPAMLMAATAGAGTGDIEAYKSILASPELKDIVVTVREVEEPEVQRIRITASEQSAYLDARNRGGGRVRLVAAEPSLAAAREAAAREGIHLSET
ncbi:MAG: serine dehydratase [Planctomycetota bacterium]|jgi:L-serine dehydratase|nr:serine dehydratase [Planctomycetota bacterium]